VRFPPFGYQTSQEPTYLFSRLAALTRLRHFGIYLTGPKQDAVMRGDISNTVVHPFFVHNTAGVGMLLGAGAGAPPAILRLLAKHGQLVLEQLAEIIKGSDAYLKVQALLYFATGGLYEGWFKHPRHHLTRACIALGAAKLRFIPATGRPPGLTDDVYERLLILSQIVYFENYMFLAVDGVEPKMAAQIEEEFRHELQVRGGFLFVCGVG